MNEEKNALGHKIEKLHRNDDDSHSELFKSKMSSKNI